MIFLKKMFIYLYCVILFIFMLGCASDSDLISSVLEEKTTSDAELVPDEVFSDYVLDQVVSSELRAFPMAEGAGAYATGGRGGKVLHVNTLDDGDYEGTFRWALNQDYPRIIVFDISGTIKLNDYLFLYSNNNNLTIAGQTAPKGGITVEGPTIGFWKMNNVIIRYIRFVNTSYFDKGVKGASFSGSGCNNLILDHCSFRYSVGTSCVSFQDDADKIDGQGNITIQRSILGDSTTGMLVGSVANDDDRVVLAGSNSVIDNLFINISHRFPNVSGNAKVEVINNVVYNYLHRLSSLFNESRTNIIGNYYKAGATSNANYGANFQLGTYLGAESIYNLPKAFIFNNIIKDKYKKLQVGDDNWDNVVLWYEWNKTTPTYNINEYKLTNKQEDLGPLTIESPEEGYKFVITNVGANVTLKANGSIEFFLDDVDSLYIDDVTNDGRKSIDEKSDYSYIDNTDRSQLLYPDLISYTRSDNYDTDRDGIPDVWERAMKYKVGEDDSSLDADGDGYTNIEEYLNLVDLYNISYTNFK